MTERRFQGCRTEHVGVSHSESRSDWVAAEEPLEIQVVPEGGAPHPIAVTMRTPGHDAELAVGFLVGEGLLRSPSDVAEVSLRVPRPGEQVRVVLRPGVPFDAARFERHVYTTSSCGVCGKTSLQALELQEFPPVADAAWELDAALVRDLPRRLREAQAVFERTGGLHAAGIFGLDGHAMTVREDVGRHNAVDKAAGERFLAGAWPLREAVLVVSGRASFELVQKALASGIPMLVAVGAPSSLAVETAERFGLTLVGFTRADGFNIYAGGRRVRQDRPSAAPLPAEIPA